MINPIKATLAVAQTSVILALAIGVGGYVWTLWAIIPMLIVIAGGQQACFVLAQLRYFRLRSNSS